jgi:uncharacterized protein (TIGR02611 family)
MSPGVEDNSQPRATGGGTAPAPASGMTIDRDAAGPARGPNGAQMDSGPQQQPGLPPHHGEHQAHHHHHHVWIEPDQDRWRWRRKIRSNPHQLRIYRSLVALAGLLLVCLGFVSGPIPGPGGIPLVLLGLAIWSSEFEWAHQLMMWFKAQLHRYHQLSPHWKIACWVVFFICCGLIGYSYLLVLGAPGWLPDNLTSALNRLPWVG